MFFLFVVFAVVVAVAAVAAVVAVVVVVAVAVVVVAAVVEVVVVAVAVVVVADVVEVVVVAVAVVVEVVSDQKEKNLCFKESEKNFRNSFSAALLRVQRSLETKTRMACFVTVKKKTDVSRNATAYSFECGFFPLKSYFLF